MYWLYVVGVCTIYMYYLNILVVFPKLCVVVMY